MVFARDDSVDEIKELPKWKKIEEAGIGIILKRFIDNREVVTKRELMSLWGVDRKTPERYAAKGMPIHICSIKGFQVFDLLLCEEWREENVNKSQSLKAGKSKTKQIEVEIGVELDEVDLDIKEVSVEEAERRLKIKENIIKDYKIKELSGEYIKSETTDKITAELGATFIGWLVNSRETLSRDLANRSKGEIFSALDEHFGKFIQDLGKRLGEDYTEEDMTVYEFLHIVQFKLEDYKSKLFKFLGIKD